MADISKISPDNGITIYNLKDIEARKRVPEVLLKNTVGWTGKNLLKLRLASGSTNGVSYTVNIDGSIALNGTATNDAYITLHSRLTDPIELESGDYILNGCPANGGGSTYQLYFAKSDGSSLTDYFYDNGNGVSFSYDGQYNYTVNIIVKSGQNVDGKVFYPMIRHSSISSSAYEPYHANVDYVKANRDEVKDVVGWSGKNLVRRNESNVINGITFTVNNDNSVTVNGTATNTAFWGAPATIEVGDFIMSGCPQNGSGNSYLIDVRNAVGGSSPYSRDYQDIGNGIQFHNDAEQTVYINIRIASGYTANNLVFKPMLRKANITDSTYEPYHPSVEQTLRDNVDNITDTFVRDSNNEIQTFVSTKVWTLESATFYNIERAGSYELIALPPSGSPDRAIQSVIDSFGITGNATDGYNITYKVAGSDIGIRYRLLRILNIR